MIGIITFVGTQSHGACLQAYALQRKIRELGFDARIIPYQCRELKKEMDKRLPTAGGSLKKRAGLLARYPVIRDRYRKFAAFESQYLGVEKLTPEIDFSEYDRIIAGSDQIWNLEITGGDYSYFLTGIDPAKKATYAASLGTESFLAETEEKCLSLIDEIPFVNVREKNLKDYLEKKLPDKKIGLVLDPTQLIEADEWRKLAGETPIRRKKYLLVHFPAEDAGTWEMIHKIAKKKGLEVVFLTNRIKVKKGCHCIYSADPFEYLNLVRHADYVITGSFHTLSFSLLFERQFLCTKAMIGNRNSRLSSLLDLAGLSDRILTESWSDAPVDHEKARERLREEREYSEALLLEACEGVSKREIPEPAHRKEDEALLKKAEKGVPQLFCDREDCSGCTACMNICPVNAISMEPDREGFLYPVIDADKCVHCRRCVRVCPFKEDRFGENNRAEDALSTVRVYAGRLRDQEQLLRSSSGGAFTALSDLFLKEGGAVICSTYDYEEHRVYFALMTDPADRDRARGSKYVQSSPAAVFKQAEMWLIENADKSLLFVGVGCQTAGMISYAKAKGFRDRVTAVDIICHGAMSPGLWKDYMDLLESKHGKADFITFKDKRNGWKAPVAAATAGGREVSLKDYVHIFYSRMALRPSCHKCPWAAVDRGSDLTIGDFWGIEKALPSFYSEEGVSLFLIHTEKGQLLFERAKEAMITAESNREDCLQPNLVRPTPVSDKRQLFWRDYEKRGIGYIVRRYGKDPLPRIVKRKTMKALRSLSKRP